MKKIDTQESEMWDIKMAYSGDVAELYRKETWAHSSTFSSYLLSDLETSSYLLSFGFSCWQVRNKISWNGIFDKHYGRENFDIFI